MKTILSLFVIIAINISCNDDPNPSGNLDERQLTFDFEENLEGWEGGFADYPVEDPERFELIYEHSILPDEIGETYYGAKIGGQNLSDDLFMFLKKAITGLKPSTQYEVQFNIELASQYPEESVGIGGSPGGSVFLKAGASSIEPLPIVQNGYYRMNIDKGNQSQDGNDMTNIGTIGIEGEEFRYELIQRGNGGTNFQAQSDGSGQLWLIIGTDSGFEGRTELYYNTINIHLKEVP
ncbi:hypothetical protein QWY93_01690 [Echinicola jeungdonensis]|uniref:Lipoprotein n=1 Tax=Echinicola jeungdonensis TaxID=709343 RepID=A0ABV5J636_9BACT|nr:hypothetical protein [Echinicola jeungdonensis]MDN3668048.1 hypothetical protein [Echinicola jeungdonensis]